MPDRQDSIRERILSVNANQEAPQSPEVSQVPEPVSTLGGPAADEPFTFLSQICYTDYKPIVYLPKAAIAGVGYGEAIKITVERQRKPEAQS